MQHHPGRGLNRTSVGLKANHRTWRVSAIQAGLNRTSVGLKAGRAGCCGFRGRSLNRTSVGLKGKENNCERQHTTRPQSNQRGIERAIIGYVGALFLQRPQSNQRGIESKRLRKLIVERVFGLNRTSVGLKDCSSTFFLTSRATASIEPAWD